MKLNFRKKAIPPANTPEEKGLQMVMGGIFLLIVRLMVTNGLEMLSLFAAGIFLAIGMKRWNKPLIILAGVVLSAVGLAEFSISLLTGTTKTILIILLHLVGFGAAFILMRTIFSYGLNHSTGKTADIFSQRRLWLTVAYPICAAWSLFDALTGLYPNIGVIMRVMAILADIFFLSALFQLRSALVDKA